MHKSTQYCADTTKTGSVHAVDMRGYKRYAHFIMKFKRIKILFYGNKEFSNYLEDNLNEIFC